MNESFRTHSTTLTITYTGFKFKCEGIVRVRVILPKSKLLVVFATIFRPFAIVHVFAFLVILNTILNIIQGFGMNLAAD